MIELDRVESAENIQSMAKNIADPVLILWGEHDRVSSQWPAVTLSVHCHWYTIKYGS